MRKFILSATFFLAACPGGPVDDAGQPVIPDAAGGDVGFADTGAILDSGTDLDTGIQAPCSPQDGLWEANYTEVNGDCGARSLEVISFDNSRPDFGGCEITSYGELANRCEIYVESKCSGDTIFADSIFRVDAETSKGTTVVEKLACASTYIVRWRLHPGRS